MAADAKKRAKHLKPLTDHQNKTYEIDELKDFKCPCCGNPLKNLVEVDLINLVDNAKLCSLCQSGKIKQKEYCVKWVYGCPDGHKGILMPNAYNGVCPELVEDTKGKMKKCGKPLEKVGISIVEVITKYVCPLCKETYYKSGQCPACKKGLVKIKTCCKSGEFPHVNEKEWEKQQKIKRDAVLKEADNSNK